MSEVELLTAELGALFAAPLQGLSRRIARRITEDWTEEGGRLFDEEGEPVTLFELRMRIMEALDELAPRIALDEEVVREALERARSIAGAYRR
jgi:hypothetical protein